MYHSLIFMALNILNVAHLIGLPSHLIGKIIHPGSLLIYNSLKLA